jgi:hypothetical protein
MSSLGTNILSPRKCHLDYKYTMSITSDTISYVQTNTDTTSIEGPLFKSLVIILGLRAHISRTSTAIKITTYSEKDLTATAIGCTGDSQPQKKELVRHGRA